MKKYEKPMIDEEVIEIDDIIMESNVRDNEYVFE